MTSAMLRGVRGGFALLAAGTMSAAGGAAAAQASYPAGAAVQPADAGAELRRHLSDLAANPRSLASLTGAGRAALDVGDGQAALGFFARAEEIAPADARVKAGMASAFVLLEQPQAALRFFAEATRLGAPEAEIARDRGLAFDMSGNPRRAQQDYALLLQRGEDAEARRRMALSLAISGHREAALRTLDPLLRRQDRAAYRTRAFVLALTGDANGAVQAVDAAMPGQGQAMAPFLTRLGGLNPAQKAMAVHFGQFPADGRSVQMAQAVDTSAHPAAVALSGARPNPPQASFGRQAARAPATQQGRTGLRRRTAAAAPAAREPRRRPGAQELDMSGRIGPGSRSQPRRTPAQRDAAAPVRAASRPTPVPSQPLRTDPAGTAPQPGFTAPAQQQPVRTAAAPPLDIPPAMIPDPVEAPPRTAAPAPAAAPAQRSPGPAAPAFSDIAELVQALPEDPQEQAAPPRPAARQPAASPPSRTAAARSTPAATRARTPAQPAHPARHWVQIAGGERTAFGFEFRRIGRSAPELLGGRTAYWARNGNSNRLLVGPFASAAEARAFVNQLARREVPAFAWTSAAGEEVARLPAR